MKNYVQEGNVVVLTAPYTVASGAGAKVGALFGVAVNDVTSGATGPFQITGVVDLAKDTSVFSAGDIVYWDNTNKVAISTAAGNMPIGRAIAGALTGAATVRVLLLGAGALPQIFVSAEQTGTGSAQNVAHGLGVTPSFVMIAPTDTAPSTTGAYTAVEGTHTSTNVVVTVTTSKKFKVLAIA
jgi:predicted RecA/RadA family phage recombinase